MNLTYQISSVVINLKINDIIILGTQVIINEILFVNKIVVVIVNIR
jgi:hypothetical protein